MKISIIIPAKDEQQRLPLFLREVIAYVQSSSHEYEIIVVDDGSQDQTAPLARSFQRQFPMLKVLSLGVNYGKGYAVKQGFLLASFDIVLFIDADGSTKPSEIERHLPLLQQGFDVVIGSRVLTDGQSKVEALAHRRWIGTVFNFLVSTLLIKGIKDTQCGFKMFHRQVALDIFKDLHLNGFGFDLEILHLAQKKNYKIKEVAVNWTHVDGSKVRLVRDSFGMFCNILQIKQWHRSL